MRKILDTIYSGSTAVAWVSRLRLKYNQIEDTCERVYLESLTHKLLENILVSVETYYNASSMKKIFEIRRDNSGNIIKNSKAVARIYPLFNTSEGSRTTRLANNMKNMLHEEALRNIGIVIIAGIFANMVLSLLLGHRIGLAGWVMRGLALLAGIGALSSRAVWTDVKKTSRILNFKILSNAQKTER